MPIKETWPYYLANAPVFANTDLSVRDKYTGEIAARVARADRSALLRAIEAAAAAAEPMRRMRPYQRKAVLEHCARRFTERAGELAEALCVEAGKPIVHSRGEVQRLIDTFTVAAEESTRQIGEVLPLEISARAHGYQGFHKRVPLGPCAFITPFNFPLNLVAHKVAPALAAGCPFVLKPASDTPIGALIIGEVLAECELPTGAFSILPCRGAEAEPLVTDERIKLLSFTGSDTVGWGLQRQAGKKRVMLELGGNAACIVDHDTDIEDAVGRIVIGAFYQSGQSCISVQRILVHEAIYERFRDALVARTRALRMGDPRDEATFIGPIISEEEAVRMERWIAQAVEAGATLLCGGRRDGVFVEATLLEGVPRDQPLVCEEVFGPVAVLSSFSRFEDALAAVNDSRFGLQAGVFTRDLYKAHRAWDELEVGGVVIGDVPSWRVDHMPYGGSKDSGNGREGIRFSMQEMTEIRLMVVRELPVAPSSGT